MVSAVATRSSGRDYMSKASEAAGNSRKNQKWMGMDEHTACREAYGTIGTAMQAETQLDKGGRL